MDQNREILHLSGADCYITEEEKSAYKVQSGRVYVYVAPLKNGKPMLRRLLCEVEEGRLIPSLRYRDGEYTEWRFVLVPQNEAELLLLRGQATSVLYRRFAANAGLENYRQEGFAQCLVDYYKKEALKDHVFLDLGSRQRHSVNIANYGVIRQSFDAGEDHVSGSSPLYRAVAFACKKSGIPIPEEEKLAGLSRKEISVTEIARRSHFLCRHVVLEKDWFLKDCGTICGFLDGRPVACVPRGQCRYTVYYGDSGSQEPLTEKIARQIEPRAFVLGRALPPDAMQKKDLVRFGIKSIRRADVVLAALLGLAAALVGLLLPMLNRIVVDEYIPLGNVKQLVSLCALAAAFMLGSLFFDMVRRLCEFRIGSHVACDLQNALYARVFRLPESFFREFESAEVAARRGQPVQCGLLLRQKRRKGAQRRRSGHRPGRVRRDRGRLGQRKIHAAEAPARL